MQACDSVKKATETRLLCTRLEPLIMITVPATLHLCMISTCLSIDLSLG